MLVHLTYSTPGESTQPHVPLGGCGDVRDVHAPDDALGAAGHDPDAQRHPEQDPLMQVRIRCTGGAHKDLT